MKPAVIIVDMLEDTYGKEEAAPMELARIVAPVRAFLTRCRALSVPVIFACDSFLEGDFIFKGRMKPHCIRGTAGARPAACLSPGANDSRTIRPPILRIPSAPPKEWTEKRPIQRASMWATAGLIARRKSRSFPLVLG